MSPRPGPIKHGTIYAYKARGCRCEACVRANTETCKAERRRRGILAQGNACQVGDKTFTRQIDAAHASGRSKSAISYHLNTHGSLDRLGAKPGGHNGGIRKPVRIGASEWPSRSALARDLGLPISTVNTWVARGDMNALIGAVMNMSPERKAG